MVSIPSPKQVMQAVVFSAKNLADYCRLTSRQLRQLAVNVLCLVVAALPLQAAVDSGEQLR